MRNYFRFLKPDKWVIILTVIIMGVILWIAIIPTIGGPCDICKDKCASIVFYNNYCTTSSGANLIMIINISLIIGSIIILYTLLSLIIYLVRGDWKNDR